MQCKRTTKALPNRFRIKQEYFLAVLTSFSSSWYGRRWLTAFWKDRRQGVATIRLYDKVSYEQMNTHISNYFSIFDTDSDDRDVNENLSLLKRELIELGNTFMPSFDINTLTSSAWVTLSSLSNKKITFSCLQERRHVLRAVYTLMST